MTRLHLLSLSALILSLAAVTAAVEKPGPSDWPVFRGNPLQTAVAGTEVSDPLKQRWKVHLGGDIEGTAAVVGDTVYVGCYDEHLHALDLATGKEKWKYKAAAEIKAPASVHGDAVYVGDSEGLFHCVDAATGKKRWTFKTGGEITAGAGFAGETVLVGSADETLYCLSKEGKELWQFKIA